MIPRTLPLLVVLALAAIPAAQAASQGTFPTVPVVPPAWCPGATDGLGHEASGCASWQTEADGRDCARMWVEARDGGTPQQVRVVDGCGSLRVGDNCLTLLGDEGTRSCMSNVDDPNGGDCTRERSNLTPGMHEMNPFAACGQFVEGPCFGVSTKSDFERIAWVCATMYPGGDAHCKRVSAQMREEAWAGRTLCSAPCTVLDGNVEGEVCSAWRYESPGGVRRDCLVVLVHVDRVLGDDAYLPPLVREVGCVDRGYF